MASTKAGWVRVERSTDDGRTWRTVARLDGHESAVRWLADRLGRPVQSIADDVDPRKVEPTDRWTGEGEEGGWVAIFRVVRS